MYLSSVLANSVYIFPFIPKIAYLHIQKEIFLFLNCQKVMFYYFSRGFIHECFEFKATIDNLAANGSMSCKSSTHTRVCANFAVHYKSCLFWLKNIDIFS